MAEQKGANKMSKHSLNIAVKYGESLREFRDQSEAEDYYISYKDDLLNRLNEMWVHSPPLGAQANFNRIEKHDTM